MDSIKNKHIEEYLDYYLQLESPQYAVMLRGKWGSGKTWFIKNYINAKAVDNFLYVSLYGVTSYSDIEEALFKQLHPVLASKGMKLAGTILKGLLKTAVKIDFDGDKKEELTVSSGVPAIKFPEYLKNLDGKFLVFDDLERCSIPIYNILGYINQFVENDGLKVIILANEEEIIKLNATDGVVDNSKAYLTIKEKLIGKSFDIQTNFDTTINAFISNIEDEKLQLLLNKSSYILKEIFIAAKYDNLRHLKQSLLDFERFYKNIPIAALDNEELINHLISIFFSIAFELKKGAIIEDEIPNIFNRFVGIKDEKKPNEQLIREKYSIFRYYPHPIKDEILVGFFKYGIVDKEKIELSIENSSYFKTEKTPDWVKLWHVFDIEDDDFPLIYDNVLKQFRELAIDDKYILIQIVGMLLNFNKMGLISIKKAEVIKIGKQNVERLKEKGLLNFDSKDDEFTSNSSHGLVFQGQGILEMDRFLKYIQLEIKKHQTASYPLIGKELLIILGESVDRFIEKISLTNSSENLYFETPILKYISPSDFIKVFLKLSNSQKKKFGWKIEQRYRFENINVSLKDEFTWLKKCVELLIKEKKKLNGGVSAKSIEIIVLPALERSMEKLK